MKKIGVSATSQAKVEEQSIDQEWVKIISKFNNLKCDKDESFMLLRDVFQETFRRKLSDLEDDQDKARSRYIIENNRYYSSDLEYRIQKGSLEIAKENIDNLHIPITKVREKPTPPVEPFETYTFFQDIMKTLDIVKDNKRLERNRKSREHYQRRKKKNEINLRNSLDKSTESC